MSTVYRKSIKGIDEVAFKAAGLPMRLSSYLLVIDGQKSVEQLVAENPHLPSLGVVLQGLAEQGFLELAGGSASNAGAATPSPNSAPPQRKAPAFAQTMPQVPPRQAPAPTQLPELDNYKANMVRDVSLLLGADAGPVIQKIQACMTRDDLFSTMMGIKKIITIYVDRDAAEKFVSRYQILAN